MGIAKTVVRQLLFWSWISRACARASACALPSPGGYYFRFLPLELYRRKFENFRKLLTLFSTQCKITELVAFRRSITQCHVCPPPSTKNLTSASTLHIMSLIICAYAHVLTKITYVHAQIIRHMRRILAPVRFSREGHICQ